MAGAPVETMSYLAVSLVPAAIAGDNLVDAFHDLEYGFRAPEAAAGEDGSLFARSGLDVHGGIGKRSLSGGHQIASHSEESESKD